MDEPNPASAANIRAKLQTISGALRHADHLTPDARQQLADLVEELSAAVSNEAASSPTTKHLNESIARLALAIQENHAPGLLESARERLSQTVVAAEIEAPVLSGIAARFIQALADIGI